MKLEVLAVQQGLRIDQFISVEAAISRSLAQKLIEDGAVRLSGASVKKNHRVTPGEWIELLLPEPEEVSIAPQEIPLDIVFEDRDLLVLNKPRGMVVHPSAGHADDTMVNALLWHCRGDLSGINGELRPGIVHRLDKDTSGLILVAKNDLAHLSLAAQIKAHTARRVYETVVQGGFKEDLGRIDRPIGRHPTDRKKMSTAAKVSRAAATQWEVLERFELRTGSERIFTHLRCILETGRTHQIRVHLASIGHPVIGDALYGPPGDRFSLGGQCLHAKEISFDHPRTGERIHLVTDYPEYFKNILTTLRAG